MQNDPEKTVGNYNELLTDRAPIVLPKGTIELEVEEQDTIDQQAIVRTGLELVNSKVDTILGSSNKLTKSDLGFPRVRFITANTEHPNWTGYFSSGTNEITIITGKIKDQLSQTKVFIHEYIHFLSHNGRDDSEQIDKDSPIARNNNVGFSRYFGLDIRKGKEGENTSDYFLAFNEAVTEQLAIDILPGVHETYSDYRGLLNQVIDDVVTKRLGSKNESGAFQPWSREQIKGYIYTCFFRGDLDGFTQLLRTTYEEYDIPEMQFGLMTHRDDLPSVIESSWVSKHPDTPPPSPSQVAVMVQERLDNKTPDDYLTDIVGLESTGNDHDSQAKYGAGYDTYVMENKIIYASRELVGGKLYDVDSQGLIIYHGEEASSIFKGIRTELDDLLINAVGGSVDAQLVAERIDQLLFDTYSMSMLSEGFRDFYIYKHSKIDNL